MKILLSVSDRFKRKFVYTNLIGIFFLSMLSVACHAGDPFRVFVSVAPQKYFVERIAGDLAVVEVMVETGKTPETYEPSPRQLVRLTDASLYFSIGVAFEKVWMSRIEDLSEELMIVDTAAGIEAELQDLYIAEPHVWTSPLMAQSVALEILNGLVAVDQDNADTYQQNYTQLLDDLKQLHEDIDIILKPWSGQGQFLVMHPAWHSFASTYGLEQVALEKEGKEPTAKELASLIQWAKSEEIQVVFIQEQHSKHMAENVAEEIGASLVNLDPLAEDYINNLRQVAIDIAESLSLSLKGR